MTASGGAGETQSAIKNPKSKITVVPICVDPEQVAVAPRQDGGPPTILHLGTMFWPPNVTGVLWFAREVLPLVHADGENILIAGGRADNSAAAAFADATVRLLTDPALNARLRAAGRAWVEDTYAWQAVYRRVDEVYRTLVH